jgi:hypothetical protein
VHAEVSLVESSLHHSHDKWSTVVLYPDVDLIILCILIEESQLSFRSYFMKNAPEAKDPGRPQYPCSPYARMDRHCSPFTAYFPGHPQVIPDYRATAIGTHSPTEPWHGHRLILSINIVLAMEQRALLRHKHGHVR